MANECGNFFEKKIDGTHESLDALSLTLTSPSSDSGICTTHAQMPGESALHPRIPCKLSAFKSLSSEEMQELITRSPIKSYPLDPIPSSVLVQIEDILLPVLTSMVNLSFMYGHFPDAWKEAFLFQALKKPKLRCGI